MSDEKQMDCYYAGGITPTDASRRAVAPSELAPARGSAAGVKYPKGVCIVCGSVLLIQYWRGHPLNQRIHCNDCGSEVTPLMHEKKQPNA